MNANNFTGLFELIFVSIFKLTINTNVSVNTRFSEMVYIGTNEDSLNKSLVIGTVRQNVHI